MSRPSTHLSQRSLKIAPSEVFDKEDDKYEALEHNGHDLPEDYLLAKMSFTREEADRYKQNQREREPKDDLRRTTGHHFHLADMYHTTQDSFNQMLASDKPDDEVDERLGGIVKEFRHKTEFLQALKSNNKNIGREWSEPKEIHKAFATATLSEGHIPVPILLKIKHGIFFIPSIYTVSDGLAKGIRAGLKNIEKVNGG